MSGRHDTVGLDIVNHCTNDIIVQGAKPLFFLDYLACGKFEHSVFEDLMKGLTAGCRLNGMALVGGETAEMPGLYKENEYDLAGFILGAVEKDGIIDGSGIKEGDVLIGLRSSGLHTNGYSLVRKVLFDMEGMALDHQPEGLDRPIVDELLSPHRSYLEAFTALKEVCEIKGMAHITGGGLTDNLPRILPEGTSALIKFGSWPIPQIFKLIISFGGISSDEALRVFNMGVGFVVVVDSTSQDKAVETLNRLGMENDVIGQVVKGDNKEVIYEGV